MLTFGASTQIMYGMEEKNSEKNFPFFGLDPELQIYTLKQGIAARLNSNDSMVEAVLDAFKYINNATSANKSLYPKKQELIEELKKLAKEKFAPEYLGLTAEELGQKMDNLVLYHINSMQPDSKASYLNDIAKLVIAGVELNVLRKFKIAHFLEPISPLIIAVVANNLNLVQLMIVYGADVNLALPLHHIGIADETGLRIAKLLIARGADVNSKTSNFRTPLIIATISDQKELVNLLLKHHADATIKDGDGKTALDYAIQRNNTDLIKILSEARGA